MLPLTGRPRQYAWGSREAIPALLRAPASAEPLAELWFGTHPGDPADTPRGPLTAVLDEPLPYLVKLLAADAPLSLQVHPSAAQAAAGFALEEAQGIPRDAFHRRYRDPFAKPELVYPLTPFDALCSFRPVHATRAFLAAVGVPFLLEGTDLRSAVSRLFALSVPACSTLVAAVSEGCERLVSQHGPWRANANAILRLATEYPGDIGVAVALFLNHLCLAPGEALFLGPGQIHAYLSGTAVEVMGPSDNVLRAGLTPKYVDVPSLLEVASFEPVAVAPQIGPLFAPPVPDFCLSVLRAGEAEFAPPDQPVLVLALDGGSVGSHELAPGAAVLIEATDTERLVSSRGRTFIVAPGVLSGDYIDTLGRAFSSV